MSESSLLRCRKIHRPSLLSLTGIITETGRIYRKMKRGKIDDEPGRSLVWVLSQLRAMLEVQALEGLEARMAALQAHAEKRHLISYSTRSNGNGVEDADRPIVAAN